MSRYDDRIRKPYRARQQVSIAEMERAAEITGELIERDPRTDRCYLKVAGVTYYADLPQDAHVRSAVA